jgi:hypothetical protein
LNYYKAVESIGLPLEIVLIPEMPTMEVYERYERYVNQIKVSREYTPILEIFSADLRQYREEKLELIGFKGHFRFGTYQLQP